MIEVHTPEVIGAIKLIDGLGSIDSVPILDEAAALLLNRIRKRFIAEEGPEGPWKPSKAGLKRKAGGYTYRNGKKYTATGTLFETGTLFHSLQVAKRGSEDRAFYTDVPYGKYHQFGRGQVKRAFLGFTNDDTSVATKLILFRVREKLNG